MKLQITRVMFLVLAIFSFVFGSDENEIKEAEAFLYIEYYRIYDCAFEKSLHIVDRKNLNEDEMATIFGVFVDECAFKAFSNPKMLEKSELLSKERKVELNRKVFQSFLAKKLKER